VRGTSADDSAFNDFWEAHGSKFGELVQTEGDKSQLKMVYAAFRNNPEVSYEDSKSQQMLEVIKAALGGPEAPPPAAPAAALEVPQPPPEEMKPPGEMAA
jgi:hypothetical protein